MNNPSSLTSTHFPLLFQIALDLFRRPSPSGQEDLVRSYVVDHLEQCGFTVTIDEIGDMLAVRGTPAPDEGYPLLSFHMDCVTIDADADDALVPGLIQSHRVARRRTKRSALSIRPLDALETSWGWLHSRGKFVLGGDDKCGGAIALTLASTTDIPLKIVASVQEEIGCVGIEQVDSTFFADVAYALVLDRRGANHLVVTIAGQILCQGVFAATLMQAAAATGLVVYAVEGALSDALHLSHYIKNVANLSVGYVFPHTLQERVSLEDLWHSYQWVFEALQCLPRHQSGYKHLFPQQMGEEEMQMCSHCQQLVFPLDALPSDLQRFVCQCAK